MMDDSNATPGAGPAPVQAVARERRPRRGIGWRNALILVAILAVSTWWFHFRVPSAPGEGGPRIAPAPASATDAAARAKSAMSVTVVRPVRGEWAVRLSADGSIAAWQDVSISPEVGGLRIAEVKADVGDQVKRGQVLAVLFASSLDNDLAAQTATLAEARATLAEAAANAERARTLSRSGAISAQQIEQYETALKTANARVQAAQARIRSERLRLSQTQVLANDDGVIATRNATVGAVAQAGQELFSLIRHGRLEWRGQIAAADLSRLATGQTVQLQLPDGMTTTGTVRSVAPTIDPQTRNGLVYVDLPPLGTAAGSAPLVLPGMFARGEVDLGRSPVLTLPASAVLMREGFAYVFKLDADGKRVSAVKVLTGRRQGDRIEIVDGVQADETVVERGVGFLADGDLVTIASEGAAAGSRR